MGNPKGLASIVSEVSELRVERTNLVNQLRHVDAALSVLGKLHGGSSYTKPRRTLPAVARVPGTIRVPIVDQQIAPTGDLLTLARRHDEMFRREARLSG